MRMNSSAYMSAALSLLCFSTLYLIIGVLVLICNTLDTADASSLAGGSRESDLPSMLA